MNYLLLSVLTLFSAQYIAAQDKQGAPLELTEIEEESYVWFQAQHAHLPPILPLLSKDDQEVFNQQMRYSDNPAAVTRSRKAYVNALCAQAQRAKIELPANQAVIESAVLKSTQNLHNNTIQEPKNPMDVRGYVFFLHLTKYEQALWTRDCYRANREAAQACAKKWSKMVVAELVKRNMIENETTVHETYAQNLFQEKIATLEKNYYPQKK